MTQDVWVTSHPYLHLVAFLQAQVKSEIAGITATSSEILSWNEYLQDFADGVPLLRSAAVAIDWLPAERMIRSKLERLAASPMPQIADEIRIVEAELRG